MTIEKEIVDRLLADYRKPEDLTGENGVLRQLTKALMERALEAEMANHLGYEKHDQEAKPSGNRRNGKSKKTLKGEFGEIEIVTPRDREATFEPQIIPKGQTRMAGLDGKILSMYARGMTTRDIQGHLEEMYGVTVSPTLISNVTDAVLDEVRAWQNRPLDAVYPIVYLDALVVKMREEGTAQNRAVYVAIGITMEGHKEVLGLWTSANEGAKFWLSVLNELKTRGVEDIFIACVDGLRAAFQPIDTCNENIFPSPSLQLVEHAQPKLGSLVGAAPQPQHFFVAFHGDADGHVDGPILHRAFLTHLDHQGIQVHDRVYRIQRPVLPGSHFVQHRIGDVADEGRAHLHPVDLLQVPLDVARGHATRIHRQDLGVQARHAGC